MSAGVETQIVEILVVGLPQTGKSTFMKTISNKTQFEDNNPEGWLEGYLPVEDDIIVHFLEPPSAASFDFIWVRDIIEQTDVPGFIVLCDSTQPQYFGEMIGILQTVVAYHPETPCVLVANMQDRPDAWSPDDIRLGLGIPDELLVLPCIASNLESVKEVVLQLLYRIFQ